MTIIHVLGIGLGEARGQITILAEEVQDSKFTIHMQLSASKLDKKDLFGKVNLASNPNYTPNQLLHHAFGCAV